jgi:AAA+ superfamily predicted ATPase
MEIFDFNNHIQKIQKPKVDLIFDNKEEFYAYMTKLINALVIKQSNGKKNLVVSDDFGQQLIQVFKYLNRDETLENEKTSFGQNWNLDAGIIFMGNFGTGKTLILRSIYELMRNKARSGVNIGIQGRYVTARQITTKYQFEPKDLPNLIGKDENDIFIDELGDEPLTVSNYGTSESPVYAVLKQKLDDWDKYERKPRVFATTNLNKAKIIERYSERIWSRMKAATNIVLLGAGKDSIDMRGL